MSKNKNTSAAKTVAEGGKEGEIKPSAAKNVLQFIKFGLVGVTNTLIDFLIYTLLVLLFGTLNDNPLIIGLFTLIAYACGVLNSFLLNSRWTFREEYKKTTREVWLFIAVNAASWLVSYALVWVFTKYVFADSGFINTVCGWLKDTSPEKIEKVTSIMSKLVAAPIVIIVNFVGNKLFVFTNNATAKE